MDTQTAIALAIFLFAYAAMLTERVHKCVATLAGGCAMVFAGVVGQHEAFQAVDLGVVFLLAGMMVIVHFLAESGFFGFVAVRLAQIAQGRPVPLLLLLCAVTALLSALVDNVTTVLLIAPVTFLIADRLDVSPVPYLLFEAIASNIGGTATLVGDPPNILIGSAAGLSFSAFLFNLGPVTLVCVLALLVIAYFVVRKQGHVSADIRARIVEMDAARAITNRRLLAKTLAVLGLVFTLFLVHDLIGLEPAMVALAGAALILLLTRAEPDAAFKSIEWSTLFFFIGLFMLVEGLRSTGLLDRLAGVAIHATGHDLTITALVLLWSAAIASAVLGAVPVVTTLIPVVQNIIPELASHADLAESAVSQALWWSLALGACLGGNGSLVGTAANVVVVEIARGNNHPISFWRFMAYGVPVTIATLLIASAYVLLRYVG